MRCSGRTSSTARISATPALWFPLRNRSAWTRRQAREVLEKRTYKDAVDADWEKSRRYGVTGVPTFVVGNRGVVGAQPYEALEELVKGA